MARKIAFRIALAGLIFVSGFGTVMPDNYLKEKENQKRLPIRIFMCGDVMLGRGIDQILPHPGDPALHESYMKSARGYVDIAEMVSGPIPENADYDYIWGYALKQLERMRPDLRLINLETSITTSNQFWRTKGIHYRMHPENARCLTAAGIDLCILANNHVLDWGYPGLEETLKTLESLKIAYAGAGFSLSEAESPVIFEIDDRARVIVVSCGMVTSGIPPAWSASENRSGVFLLRDLSQNSVQRVRERVEKVRKEGDVVIVSIHWGGNWGYQIPREQVRFAHLLIDEAGVDIIHGHSSHHVKGIEVYRGRPVIYGCGDFLNDYEGIGGHEHYRGDLSLMYFADLDPDTGEMTGLTMVPTQVRKFRISRPKTSDVLWLRNVLDREGERFGTSVIMNDDESFSLKWELLTPE